MRDKSDDPSHYQQMLYHGDKLHTRIRQFNEKRKKGIGIQRKKVFKKLTWGQQEEREQSVCCRWLAKHDLQHEDMRSMQSPWSRIRQHTESTCLYGENCSWSDFHLGYCPHQLEPSMRLPALQPRQSRCLEDSEQLAEKDKYMQTYCNKAFLFSFFFKELWWQTCTIPLDNIGILNFLYYIITLIILFNELSNYI